LYNVQKPIQFIKPNLFVPNLYFVLISTIRSLITLKQNFCEKLLF
jgi:hypothetical protein